MRLGSQIFAILLQPMRAHQGNETEKVEFSNLIDNNEDVLSDKLPKRLPTECIKGNFRIELKDGTKPVRRGLYRMSYAELEEV